ncbi:MerR family transcriptional regulator [Clostridium estertheticum]|uniref:MerR family transcriptional regulator n=1 Tax=Clostridium estertheticum TaxID=238834 RepID=UPI001CF3119B|nr:MerR family transcriptional regulator [Clostridium estertheticum]MCB2355548.1 MerR family transcriptional regulator [Clostridium estertheticum]WAG43031.1 MerR family transcriptional regulator [Clostridium estertheticum]
MSYKIKEVADMVGVSVRTLHHYDQIGILKPKSVTTAGYRLYTDDDLERLQQVLFFKELDFTLLEIKEILDNPDFDRKHALKTHRELLIEKKKRLDKIIKSVDKTIDYIEGGIDMTKNEMFEGFDISEIEAHKEKYAEETKQKYGDTDAYKESLKKTSKYTKEDWARINATNGKINEKIIANMDKGIGNSEVQKAVAELRQHITDNFYDCTIEIFRGLADLYVKDERFTANIDKYKEGLAKFLSESMIYYCDNAK